MNRNAWTSPIGPKEANRRAGGRRKYNAMRQRLAEQRLIPLAHQIAVLGDLESVLGTGKRELLPRHLIPALAKALGVHRSTVWRDVQRLRARRRYCWKYTSDTGLVTVWLYGLAKFTYRPSWAVW